MAREKKPSADSGDEMVAPKNNIKRARFEVATFRLTGTSPYVSNKFSSEALEMMKAKQQAGSVAKKGTARQPKDFQKAYIQSMHQFQQPPPFGPPDGIMYGVPATCFRQALVRACSLVGFKMTLGKLSLFILADGEDIDDGSPLVAFTKGVPEYFEKATRNDTGVADIRARGRWPTGWEIELRVKYDADMFKQDDVFALLERVGVQVGIGAGRADSKTSCGQGWGAFEVEEVKAKKAA